MIQNESKTTQGRTETTVSVPRRSEAQSYESIRKFNQTIQFINQ